MMTKNAPTSLSRRQLGLGATASGLAIIVPSGLGKLAATAAPQPDFRQELEALAGYKPLPEDVVQRLDNLMEGALPKDGEERKNLLTALYTGLMPADNGNVLITYAQALMFVACRDTNNAPSFCGGIPGFWADKPGTV